MSGYKRVWTDPTTYHWTTHQRKYRTTEHGGYGLDIEASQPRIASGSLADLDVAISGLARDPLYRSRMLTSPEVREFCVLGCYWCTSFHRTDGLAVPPPEQHRSNGSVVPLLQRRSGHGGARWCDACRVVVT